MADAPEVNKDSVTKTTPTPQRRWPLLVIIMVIIVICLFAIIYLWRNDVFHKAKSNTNDFSLFGAKDSVNSSKSICGNGICEKDELISGKCAKDCGGPLQANPNAQDVICGNGICEKSELTSGNCAKDCGSPLQANPNTQDVICGDGICSTEELVGKTCPQDCG